MRGILANIQSLPKVSDHMLKIKTDSRKIKSGDTFVALRGISSDGHSYIDRAIQSGATTIVAEEGSYSVETIIVPDTRKYLEETLYEKYKSYLDEMIFIGITGTNGKTTSAFLIYEALNKLNKPCAYIGTIGFYLSEKVAELHNTSPDLCDLYEMFIEAYENGFKHISIEVSSQGLAYGRFNNIHFDYAIFTNLTQDHLDYHLTMDNYALAKQTLFKQLKETGLGMINVDSDYNEYFRIGNYTTYGFGESDYQIKNLLLRADGSFFQVNDLNIATSLIGKYNVYNILCAVMVLENLRFPKEKIEKIIPTLNPPAGRMELVKYNDNTIIIDYAHTPDAMKNIFDTVKEIEHNHIYVVFGCTGSRDRKKRPIMMQMALDIADYVFVTSDDLHEEDFNVIVTDMLEGNKKKHYMVEKDRGLSVKMAIDKLDSKDLLLILGKGHEEFIIVFDKNIPFNDRKEVLKIIKEKELIEI